MGKGDIKSAKGKRVRGTFGNTRQKKQKFRKYTVEAAPAKTEVKGETTVAPAAKKPAAKKPAAKKPAAKKATTTTAKKTSTKKAEAKSSEE